MTTYVPPLKNAAFVFYVGLKSQANANAFQANPTLAAGDVKVAVDDAAPANLTTLPTVDADFTRRVKVSLSAAEMNGDNITLVFADAAGGEWCDLIVNIHTSEVQLDGVAADVEAALSGNDVEFVNPVLTDQSIDIVQGSDYYLADGRDVEFNFTGMGIPVQGTETCTLTIASGTTQSWTTTATLSSGSGSPTFHTTFQIDRSTGDLLDAGPNASFEVFISIGGHDVPLIAEGRARIRRRLS